MIYSKNPYTGQEIATFETLSEKDLNEAIALSHDAFGIWRLTSFQERSERMLNAAKVLRTQKDMLARTISEEMGKPITQAIAEIEKCAWGCEYYAKNAADFLKKEQIPTDASRSYVSYEPLGPVLAVMPWNYPFWQVFRFAAPALMAGNTGLLKHASNVMLSANNIQSVFEAAGFPRGVFQNLVIGSSQVARVIEDPRVKAVTLTGSKPAGAAVASTAGKSIKKSVLELGGSNAFIVFEDADLNAAVSTAVNARYQNTGQSCIAAKRLFLQRSIADSFLKEFKQKVENLQSGDPLNAKTYIGVMAREDLAVEIEKQVNKSLEMGAKLLLGGPRNKAYFAPTILTEVTPEMPVFNEETFGPVIGVTLFDTPQEAIALSNRSEFGLGVTLFTKNTEMAEELASEFQEGAVFINELVKSDPRLPFGGVKTSGYGRELSSHGIREFVNVKTVFIKK